MDKFLVKNEDMYVLDMSCLFMGPTILALQYYFSIYSN
jgi:hypothetical protein